MIKNSNKLSDAEKRKVLEKLNLGIMDIIWGFERDQEDSTKDKHIDPKEYKNILELLKGTDVNEILFVYKIAAKWFLHSLTGEAPLRVSRLKKYKIENGTFHEMVVGNRKVKFTLLPSPINRAKKGETLNKRLEVYKKHIKD
ncbi:MAG TPA: hypothetical protein VE978_26260 [Chitinophagales bacterium]|nr:hypothetical protein [Chitinophagales bacterium]